MKLLNITLVLILCALVVSCAASVESITSSATGDVITNIQAQGTGGGAPFDGTVNEASDLDDLVATAWGVARLGLHRGHAPIESVLEAFLGISHDEMHVLMEDEGMNLAKICEHLGLDPENLVDTLTASFVPFLEEGVENGVISSEEVEIWTERIRAEFSNRVYWEG
ncbi:MAG: hypothetical protein AAF629_24835 [Chloroflexota bacterium]